MVSQVKAKGVLGEETSNNDWILFFFFLKKLMANISIIHEKAIDFFGWKDWLLSTCPLQRKSSLTQRCGGQGVCAHGCSPCVYMPVHTLFMCIFLSNSYKSHTNQIICFFSPHILEIKMHPYSENNLMDFHYGIQASLFPKTFMKTLNYSLLIDPPPKHAEC